MLKYTSSAKPYGKLGVIVITKEKREEFRRKWDNYWYHYKWHTWAAVFIACCMLMYIGDLLRKKDYDINVAYISRSYTNFDEDAIFEKRVAEYVPDYNGDGESTVKFYNYAIPESPRSQEEFDQQMAMLARARVELTDGNTFIFIVDDDIYDYFEMDDGTSDIDYMQSDRIVEKRRFMLEGHELTEGLMIDDNDVFIVFRSMVGFKEGSSKYEKADKKREQSKEVLENIVNGNKINASTISE